MRGERLWGLQWFCVDRKEKARVDRMAVALYMTVVEAMYMMTEETQRMDPEPYEKDRNVPAALFGLVNLHRPRP